MKEKKNKLEVELASHGTGIMLYGIWTFIKLVLSALVYRPQIGQSFDPAERIAVYVAFFIIGAILFLLCFYVGISARADAFGKRRRGFYLVPASFLVLFGLLTVGLDVYSIAVYSSNLFNTVITLLIDATAFIITLQLFVNAAALRRLRKKEGAV